MAPVCPDSGGTSILWPLSEGGDGASSSIGIYAQFNGGSPGCVISMSQMQAMFILGRNLTWQTDGTLYDETAGETLVDPVTSKISSCGTSSSLLPAGLILPDPSSVSLDGIVWDQAIILDTPRTGVSASETGSAAISVASSAGISSEEASSPSLNQTSISPVANETTTEPPAAVTNDVTLATTTEAALSDSSNTPSISLEPTTLVPDVPTTTPTESSSSVEGMSIVPDPTTAIDKNGAAPSVSPVAWYEESVSASTNLSEPSGSETHETENVQTSPTDVETLSSSRLSTSYPSVLSSSSSSSAAPDSSIFPSYPSEVQAITSSYQSLTTNRPSPMTTPDIPLDEATDIAPSSPESTSSVVPSRMPLEPSIPASETFAIGDSTAIDTSSTGVSVLSTSAVSATQAAFEDTPSTIVEPYSYSSQGNPEAPSDAVSSDESIKNGHTNEKQVEPTIQQPPSVVEMTSAGSGSSAGEEPTSTVSDYASTSTESAESSAEGLYPSSTTSDETEARASSDDNLQAVTSNNSGQSSPGVSSSSIPVVTITKVIMVTATEMYEGPVYSTSISEPPETFSSPNSESGASIRQVSDAAGNNTDASAQGRDAARVDESPDPSSLAVYAAKTGERHVAEWAVESATRAGTADSSTVTSAAESVAELIYLIGDRLGEAVRTRPARHARKRSLSENRVARGWGGGGGGGFGGGGGWGGEGGRGGWGPGRMGGWGGGGWGGWVESEEESESVQAQDLDNGCADCEADEDSWGAGPMQGFTQLWDGSESEVEESVPPAAVSVQPPAAGYSSEVAVNPSPPSTPTATNPSVSAPPASAPVQFSSSYLQPPPPSPPLTPSVSSYSSVISALVTPSLTSGPVAPTAYPLETMLPPSTSQNHDYSSPVFSTLSQGGPPPIIPSTTIGNQEQSALDPSSTVESYSQPSSDTALSSTTPHSVGTGNAPSSASTSQLSTSNAGTEEGTLSIQTTDASEEASGPTATVTSGSSSSSAASAAETSKLETTFADTTDQAAEDTSTTPPESSLTDQGAPSGAWTPPDASPTYSTTTAEESTATAGFADSTPSATSTSEDWPTQEPAETSPGGAAGENTSGEVIEAQSPSTAEEPSETGSADADVPPPAPVPTTTSVHQTPYVTTTTSSNQVALSTPTLSSAEPAPPLTSSEEFSTSSADETVTAAGPSANLPSTIVPTEASSTFTSGSTSENPTASEQAPPSPSPDSTAAGSESSLTSFSSAESIWTEQPPQTTSSEQPPPPPPASSAESSSPESSNSTENPPSTSIEPPPETSASPPAESSSWSESFTSTWFEETPTDIQPESTSLPPETSSTSESSSEQPSPTEDQTPGTVSSSSSGLTAEPTPTADTSPHDDQHQGEGEGDGDGGSSGDESEGGPVFTVDGATIGQFTGPGPIAAVEVNTAQFGSHPASATATSSSTSVSSGPTIGSVEAHKTASGRIPTRTSELPMQGDQQTANTVISIPTPTGSASPSSSNRVSTAESSSRPDAEISATSVDDPHPTVLGLKQNSQTRECLRRRGHVLSESRSRRRGRKRSRILSGF
ncbi:hypothetical protein I317_03508 [Kwoniella heveanensis CBS 569]|nr:hypothetical protein I317_03508 [Kwoniella heveanensis CBS 569]